MALGTSNRDGGKTSESGHLRAIQKVIAGEVLTGLNISQRAAGANMSVDAAIGDAVIPRSDGTYGHPVFNDAVLNLPITTADPSNPRRDIVVMYVDYGETPSTAVSNNTNGVVKMIVVAGTAAGSPTDPSDATIQSAVTSGNPWIKLSRVRVGAGVTTISDSVIDDLRNMGSEIANDGMTGTRQMPFVYASTLSFTVTGIDATATFKRGTIIRLYQAGSAKWFIVESSSFSTNTTVNLSSRGLYTLSNVPIDKLTYSYTPDVVGVPAAFLDDWHQLSAMTYASASTVTVSADDYAAVEIGTKIWLTQTTSKFFYVSAKSGGNTLTLNGGATYSVANAAITAPYFSNAATPPGFPDGITDANGWKVRYQASKPIYSKKITYSQAIGGTGGNINAGMSSTNLPTGMSTLGTNFITFQPVIGGNSFGFSAVPEMTSSSSSLNFTGRSTDGTGRTYTGYFDITISAE